MKHLHVYDWEREKFPWHQRVDIKPEFRVGLTAALAKAFGLRGIYASLETNGSGRAFVHRGLIVLPKSKYRCSLAMVVHEVAHHYDYKVYGGSGHRASFKKSLIKLFVEVRAYRMLPPIFAALRAEQAASKARAQKACAVAVARATRLDERRREARSPAGKLKRAQERAKRLRTRIKRLTTALKKAERQARALERRLAPVPVETRVEVIP